jgi:hypothetical protein
MVPGPELGNLLAEIDPALVDDDADLVEMIAAWDRQIAHANARQLAAMAEFARRPWLISNDPDVARDQRGALGSTTREFAEDEIAPRLGISPGSAGYRLGLAIDLASPLRATANALSTGTIDMAKARTIADACRHLDPATAVELETAVLGQAPNLSNGRLQTALRKALIIIDPMAAQQRSRIARNQRDVSLTPLDDGVAELRAVLAAADALTIFNVLTATARAAKAAGGETRTMGQLRADFMVAPFTEAMATGVLAGLTPVKLANHRGRRAELNVTVPASVIMGVSNAPGELVGYGPITADVCRELARDATMRRLVTNPVDGTFLAADSETYKPSTALARHVEFRDQRCVFLGCPRPATRCHLDHSDRFPDGRTCHDNLGPLCERHHIFKHALDKAFEQLRHRTLQQPDAGTFVWTMPTGHTYAATRPQVGPPISTEVVGSKEPLPQLPIPLEVDDDPPPF